MNSIVLFCEDSAHEKFITSLISRLKLELNKDITVIVGVANGGKGVVITKVREYFKKVKEQRVAFPDGVIVGVDANSSGVHKTKKSIYECVPEELWGKVITAIPNPHIERWLLEDPNAFRQVFGKGCDFPRGRSSRDLFKRHLVDQIIAAKGIRPPLGGLEYIDDIVNVMDIDGFRSKGDSLGRFLSDATRFMNNLS